jgi:hypothetical protein
MTPQERDMLAEILNDIDQMSVQTRDSFRETDDTTADPGNVGFGGETV